MKYSGKLAQLPDHAEIAFKGVIFDVYQWEQRLFDGTSATFEAVSRPDSVGAICLTTSGKILLIDEEQPTSTHTATIPFGRMEAGESSAEAVTREVLEETGYRAISTELYFKRSAAGKVYWETYIYVLRGCQKVAEVNLDAGERITCREAELDQFIDDILTNPQKEPELFIAFADTILREGREALVAKIRG